MTTLFFLLTVYSPFPSHCDPDSALLLRALSPLSLRATVQKFSARQEGLVQRISTTEGVTHGQYIISYIVIEAVSASKCWSKYASRGLCHRKPEKAQLFF